MSEREEFLRVARRAREAAAELAPLPRAAKDAALHRIADALVAAAPEIVSRVATSSRTHSSCTCKSCGAVANALASVRFCS